MGNGTVIFCDDFSCTVTLTAEPQHWWYSMCVCVSKIIHIKVKQNVEWSQNNKSMVVISKCELIAAFVLQSSLNLN